MSICWRLSLMMIKKKKKEGINEEKILLKKMITSSCSSIRYVLYTPKHLCCSSLYISILSLYYDDISRKDITCTFSNICLLTQIFMGAVFTVFSPGCACYLGWMARGWLSSERFCFVGFLKKSSTFVINEKNLVHLVEI